MRFVCMPNTLTRYAKIGEQSVCGDAFGGVSAIGRNVCIDAVVIGRQIPEYALVIENPGVEVQENYQRSYYYHPKEDGCE